MLFEVEAVRRLLCQLAACFSVLALLIVSPAFGDGLADLNAALEAEKSGDTKKALELYTRSLAAGDLSHANIALASFNRGTILLRQGTYDRAIADFDTALWLDPDYREAYHNRGLARFQAGKTDDAIADFDAAIARDPGFAMAYNNRGNAYRRKAAFERAIEDYDEAIRLDPNYAFAYFNRALAYEGLTGAADAGPGTGTDAVRPEALSDYRKAYELARDHPVIRERAHALGLE